MLNQRIGVFLTRGYLDSVPSLRDGLALLGEQGYSIVVYTPVEPSYRPSDTLLDSIDIIQLPLRGGNGKISWIQDILRQIWFVWCYAGRQQYLCLIGVDSEGLLLATVASKMHRRPVIYYSLEVLCTSDKGSVGFRLLKAIEKTCHRQAHFTIIQDEARAALLASENQFDQMPYILVPNAARGKASFRRSTYLRDKLGITSDKLLIMHAGSVVDWTMAVELAQEAKAWPEEWVLVFQCRARPTDPYGQRLLALADNSKIFVNAEPVPSDRLPDIIACADIGLAIYQVRERDAIVGKNLFTMGKSSGKIAQYLQCGVPVVASNYPSIQPYIEKYPAGVLVSDISHVRKAIEEIKADYQRYSSGAVQCFQQEFDLEAHFAQVLAELKSLESSRS